MSLVDTILPFITELPPFPAVILRVLQLVEDPNSSAQDIVEVIQYDQAITANVLMVCNSAYFGLRQPVTSLRDALVKIGFNRLIEIVLARGSSYIFYQACHGYRLGVGELWRHSVACALLSQILSARLKKEKNPTQFTAALVHDVGKIILSEFVRDHLEEIKNLVQENHHSFIEAEREVLGIDHAELGGKIAERWRFPPNIISGIRYHHTPLSAPTFQELVSIVYLCDLVALMTGFGGGVDGLSYPGYKEVMKQYGLVEKDLEQIVNQLESELKQVDLILNIR